MKINAFYLTLLALMLLGANAEEDESRDTKRIRFLFFILVPSIFVSTAYVCLFCVRRCNSNKKEIRRSEGGPKMLVAHSDDIIGTTEEQTEIAEQHRKLIPAKSIEIESSSDDTISINLE